MGKIEGLTHRTLANALRSPDTCKLCLFLPCMFLLDQHNAHTVSTAPDTGKIIRNVIIPAIMRLRSLIHLSIPDVNDATGRDIDCGDIAASDTKLGIASFKYVRCYLSRLIGILIGLTLVVISSLSTATCNCGALSAILLIRLLKNSTSAPQRTFDFLPTLSFPRLSPLPPVKHLQLILSFLIHNNEGHHLTSRF